MCTSTRSSRYVLLAVLSLLLCLASPAAFAQPEGAELVTAALVHPLGITTDAQGRIWVAETGTGPAENDSRISVVLPDGQIFPFLTGIPTGSDDEGNQRSASHSLHVGDDLWFTSSVSGTESALQRISTAGWSPGDPPYTTDDIAETVDIGTFISEMEIPETNPYALALGPDGALYITDAGANLLLRYDPVTEALSVHAQFPAIENPSGIGPPFIDAVPTGIVAADGRLYVSILSGFPFAEGLARVYAVEMDGTFEVLHGNLTALNDLARDPRDGSLAALQHGVFALGPPPPGFRPGTSRVLPLGAEGVLASGFSFAGGIAYDATGVLYVGTLGGELYRVTASPVANEGETEVPARFALLGNYPNPFNPATTIAYELAGPAIVRLSIYDVLGRQVVLLEAGERSVGRHTVRWDGRDEAGQAVASGDYLVRLEVGNQAQIHLMTLVK